MSSHDRCSPSVAKRRLLCPGSARLEGSIVREEAPSEAADRGTAVHAIIEAALDGTQPDPMHWVGKPWVTQSPFSQVYSQAEGLNALAYVNYVNERRGELEEVTVYPERKVDPKRFTGRDDTKGTSDTIILADNFIEVIDYKNGYNIIYPYEPQLKLYGAGAIAEVMEDGDTAYPVDNIRLTVVQPNGKLEDAYQWRDWCDADPQVLPEGATRMGYEMMGRGPYLFWVEYPVEVLINEVIEMGKRLNLCDEPEAPVVPGDVQCMFCKAKGVCAGQAESIMTELTAITELDLFDPNETHDAVTEVIGKKPELLTPEQHVALLDAAPLIISFLKSLEKSALERHRNGEKLPGKKLVLGKPGNRAWRNEDGAILKIVGMTIDGHKFNKAEVTTTKMISPTQFEKLTKGLLKSDRGRRKFNELMKNYVTRPEGKEILVDIDDEREEVKDVTSQLLETTVTPDLSFL